MAAGWAAGGLDEDGADLAFLDRLGHGGGGVAPGADAFALGHVRSVDVESPPQWTSRVEALRTPSADSHGRREPFRRIVGKVGSVPHLVVLSPGPGASLVPFSDRLGELGA